MSHTRRDTPRILVAQCTAIDRRRHPMKIKITRVEAIKATRIHLTPHEAA
jgi:hypothetical protein